MTPQDMALLIILLVITCYLLPIPRIMLNVMRFLASKLGAFWTGFQPTNTTLQHKQREELRRRCRWLNVVPATTVAKLGISLRIAH